MPEFPPRVLAAQRAQLAARRAVLDGGSTHVGWKVALGIPGAAALVGDEPVFGYLTSASQFRSGAVFAADGIRTLQVDCELAVELGRDVKAGEGRETVTAAIAGVGTALELCDVGRSPDEFDAIVAANVFHRAFSLGTFREGSAGAAYAGRVQVNGEVRHEATASSFADRVLGVARVLEAVGERLRAGDRIICGAICGGLLERGDDVEVEVGDLGRVEVKIA